MAAEADKQAAASSQTVTTENKDSLLGSLLEQVDITKMPVQAVPIETFKDQDSMAKLKGEMVTAALGEFLKAVSRLETPLERINKEFLNGLIDQIDAQLSTQLDAVMHHPKFQQLESSWRGLKFLVDRTDFRKNVKIEMIDISKEALANSFEDAPELIQSGLYKKIYAESYDTAGGEPYSAIVSNYEFDSSNQDITLLQNVSKVSSAALCPFIGSVGPKFFHVNSMEEWKKIPNKSNYLATADYIKWRSFRESEDSRYVGLTFPRFMLRLPYGPDTVPIKGFNYKEKVTGSMHERYLWGNASFAFASNMVRAFVNDGWCVQIRGPQAGGKVENLPFHIYDEGKGKEMKAPTEVKIDDTLELETAKLGFIPFTVYENQDFAAFFSAQSTQNPAEYDSKEATANSRINARLPYIFLASRLAHYLKVIQRENIGKTKDKDAIQKELNKWIREYVTEMKNPPESLIAKHPLRAAQVTVEDIEENPGFYKVSMLVLPHFQIEGMDISLSLVSKMPKAK